MKKLLFITIAFLFTVIGYAQERTVYLNGGSSPYGKVWNFKKDGVRLVYTGTADDTLKATNQDTISFILAVQALDRANTPLHFHLNINSKGLTGTDTTFTIMSDYKISVKDDWAELVPDVTSSVNPTTGLNTQATSFGNIADYTITQTVAAYNLVVPAITALTDTAGLAGYPADSIVYNTFTIPVPQQTYTITQKQNPQLHARYMKFDLIISGDDSVGTGIEIEEVELIFDL